MAEHDLLDDETSEQLLAGRYRASEFSELAALLDDIRAAGHGPVPAPSPTLARLLRDGLEDGHPAVAPAGAVSARRVRFRFGRGGPAGSRLRSAGEAVLALSVLATALTGAAAADILPAPVRDAVGHALHAVTPLELPDEGAVVAPAPQGGSPGPTTPGAGGTRTGEGQAQPSQPGPPAGSGSSATPDAPRPDGRSGPAPVGQGPGADRSGPSDSRPGSPVTPPGASGKRGSARLVAALRGVDQSQAAGGPDRGGTVVFDLDPPGKQLCFTLMVSGAAPVAEVHLHQGPTGPVVATLAAPSNGASSGCVAVDTDVLRKMEKRPTDYFVDVHPDRFGPASLRGQLSS